MEWDHKDSNLGPPACKAGALNQLSYDPILSFILPQFCQIFSGYLRFGFANLVSNRSSASTIQKKTHYL